MIKTAFYLGTARARLGWGGLNKHPSSLYMNSLKKISDLQQKFYEIIPFKFDLVSFYKKITIYFFYKEILFKNVPLKFYKEIPL